MQFKGSVRAPGDKDPGVRVVLEIDEYHLEIRRDSELIGRYYLADVEVARDVAERFILFLGDDEVEFLADDALQFAYGGVTAMQDGWLSAQKRKRRHRRAAEDAARRKDGEPRMEMEVPVARSLHVSDSDTIRSRRRQAGAKSPEPAAPERTVAAIPPAPVAETPVETRTERRERKEAAAKPSPPVEAPPKTAPVRHDVPVAPVPVESAPETPKPRTPAKPAAVSGRRSRGGKDAVSIAARLGDSTPKADPAMDDAAAAGPAAAVPAGTEPEAVADTSLAARRKKITADAKPKGPDDLGRVRVPEPVSGRAREGGAEASATLGEQTRVEVDVDRDDARFAQEGHHPSETSTGLLAKLRRQPKLPDDHIHKFKEAGSSVGLVRRVCIECAYVSIGSDDD
ncbi:MAG TPA: hypothetical protein VM848_07435 [Acidimicrobiia bacterium]|nr:hypothetical protein [Acidimicrobiia bacterium]